MLLFNVHILLAKMEPQKYIAKSARYEIIIIYLYNTHMHSLSLFL